MAIRVTLMGSPKISIDGRDLVFPYRKAEGLFYYLCVKQTISRDEAVGIFWADSDETCARKNLRDALYNLRKLMGREIIAVEGNNRIRLIREHIDSIDFEELNSENLFERYTGDFLGYFYVKNCVEFETWATEIREELQRQYHKAAVERVTFASRQSGLDPIITLANTLLRKRFYDEALYRELMQAMMDRGGCREAEALYEKLAAILQEDLEAEPEQETQDIFRKAVQLKNECHPMIQQKPEQSYFFGRQNEIKYLLDNIRSFRNNSQAFSILLEGEPGVGKSTLLNRILELLPENSYVTMSYQCVQTEEGLYLKPWNDIIKHAELLCYDSDRTIPSLPDPFRRQGEPPLYATQYELFCRETLARLIERLNGKKLILVLDDIQWMDLSSLRILSNLIFWSGNRSMLVLMAARNDRKDQLAEFCAPLLSKNLLRELELSRFTLEETEQMVSECASKDMNNSQTIQTLYQRTGGNALFLTEFIKAFEHGGDISQLSSKVTSMIQSRLIGLTAQDYHILEYISLYPRFATLEDLQVSATQSKLDILRSLEKMLSRGLICQSHTFNRTGYGFSHQLIREYVYDHMLKDTRFTLHAMAAEAYEASYKNSHDLSCCPMLIYHFSKCHNRLKTYTYQLEYLKTFYNVAHEIYPSVLNLQTDYTAQVQQLSGEDELVSLAENIRELHRSCPEAASLRMNVEFLVGRFDLFSGNYEKGLKNIETSIQLANALGNSEYLMENYLQLVFHAIQIHDLPMLEKYIAACEALLERGTYPEEKVCTVLRLHGVYYMKVRQYEKARDIFYKVIKRMEPFYRINISYCISLAACYNYIGESYQEQGDIQKALSYYRKALSFCENQPLTCGTGIFFANAAHTLCQLNQLEESRHYMELAISCFHRHGAVWGRAKTEAYAALLAAKCGEMKQAEQYLTSARKAAACGENEMIIAMVRDAQEELSQYKASASGDKAATS